MASKAHWFLSSVFFLLFLANIWNSCTKFATNNLIRVKLAFICDQGTGIFSKSSVIAIIVCAYCKGDSIWIFCKESSLGGNFSNSKAPLRVLPCICENAKQITFFESNTCGQRWAVESSLLECAFTFSRNGDTRSVDSRDTYFILITV